MSVVAFERAFKINWLCIVPLNDALKRNATIMALALKTNILLPCGNLHLFLFTFISLKNLT